MARQKRRWKAGTAGVAVLSLTYLTACGGATKGDETAFPGRNLRTSAECGTFNLAVNPWVGYEANAAVIAYVAEHDLGCKVVLKRLSIEEAWRGIGTGKVDAIVENWGHGNLEKKYTQQGAAVDAGLTGNVGVIGWYVPPWLAKAHPDTLDYNNLNKYASKFKTSESGGKGQLLDGDPSYETNDEALVKNLGLDFKVVYAGGEAELIQAFRNAEKNKQWVIGYFYEPQWFLSEVPLVRVKLPEHTRGCDADPAKVACGYPETYLNKIVSEKLYMADSPAYKLVQSFSWTNDDQNAVARDIQVKKMSPEAAAKKWVDAHRIEVDAWLRDLS